MEMILVVLMITLAIVPMLTALTTAITTSEAARRKAVFLNRTRGTLNRVMALDLVTLNANQGYPVNLGSLFGSQAEAEKESFEYDGFTHTPVVAIADMSGGSSDLFAIYVWLDTESLSSMRTE